ncbi:dihydrolipoamide acetyltransferase family protein [Sphingobacterium faecale]|uniref:Dihydrolipoamide acetyltransferase component of pyruvate dehydrogenase complex n=1 Tax=Sphingobacterium faecale TaxID=2803775 RepID=A0ABS1R5M1_9SPHI|nr:dihydrolipoamide acetyltransferase family protein [Sphingobacterium faecale]MBL1409997.1 2-oxo acid dehydrogenase subunit E2 [Sphingobacterium faecale]
MGIFRLVLPKMGESVSEATLTKWVKAVGDRIDEDDTVVEVATDKVDSEVPSPVEGVLKEILFKEGQVAQVGDVIALLEVEGASDIEGSATRISTDIVVEEESKDTPSIPGLDVLEQSKVAAVTEDSYSSDGRFYSPLVRSIAQQENISLEELAGLKGSGSDGRVTKQDVLNYVSKRSAIPSTAIPPVVKSADKPVSAAPAQVVKVSNGDEVIEMDRMRRLIADHMVNSIRTSPHVFSVVEADVTHLVTWRNKVKDSFKKREGENITFTPLIIEAITKALKDFPMINVSVDGHNIIKRKHINIGMAAALPSGNLIVPVIKDADQLSLVGLSKAVNDLASRARGNQLKPDDTQGGTFTFTNIGAFGNIFGMPIINQPQAAILAVGTITKKPAVLETVDGDVIAIRHMMYLTMSYDHRVIDGALGGTFLKRVGDYLENWDKDREI